MGLLSRRGRGSRRQQVDPDADELEHCRTLIDKGALTEAEQLLRSLVAVLAGAPNPDVRKLAAAQMYLGLAELGLNRPEEAWRLFDAARTALQSSPRSSTGRVLALRNTCALLLVQCGRYCEAEAELEEIARICREHPAPGPPIWELYFSSREYHRWSASNQGRFDAVLSLAEEHLPQVAEAFGPESRQVYRARLHRAFALAMLGRYEQAESECRALLEPGAGPVSAGDLTDSACGLAYCLVESGRAGEAETVLHGPLAEAERDEPAGRTAAKLRRELANVLARQGRFEEALSLVQGPPAWGIEDPGQHQLVRAVALLGLGRLKEAEAAADEALAVAGVPLVPLHIRVLEIRTVLARIHDTPEEWDSVTTDWLTHYGPDHPRARAAADH